MPKSDKISNTQNLVIILTILVLLLAGGYYYFFSSLRAAGESISNLQNNTDSLLAEQANLSALRAVFSQTTSDRDKINSYFVQSDGAIDFVTTIENLAAFVNLSHETNSIDTQSMNPPDASHEILHMNFRTTGSWQNTYYFISLLETLPYNITINQINLHATGDTTNQIVAENVDLSASSSSSTPKTVTKRASVWEATYDFSVVKLK